MLVINCSPRLEDFLVASFHSHVLAMAQALQFTIREREDDSPLSEMFASEKGDDEQALKFLDGTCPKPKYNLCTRFKSDPL